MQQITPEKCEECNEKKWVARTPEGKWMCQDCYYKDWTPEEIAEI